ncbi:formate--tetrahydrofolate ligase, partial [Clostridium sp. AF43-10]
MWRRTPARFIITSSAEFVTCFILRLYKNSLRFSSLLYGVPVVVTLNRFVSDTDVELAFVREFCEKRGCDFA